MLNGEHRNQALLEAVTAMHEAHVVLAGVEHGGVLGHHQLPLHALVAEINQGHAYFPVVVGGMGAEDMAPGWHVSVPVASHSRACSFIQ